MNGLENVMHKMPAKLDAAIFGVINFVLWLVQLDEVVRPLFTLASFAFLVHRYLHWNRNKDKNPKKGEWKDVT